MVVTSVLQAIRDSPVPWCQQQHFEKTLFVSCGLSIGSWVVRGSLLYPALFATAGARRESGVRTVGRPCSQSNLASLHGRCGSTCPSSQMVIQVHQIPTPAL